MKFNTADVQQVNSFVAAAARTNLLAYSVGNWPGFLLPPHVKLLGQKLMAVERGEIKRLIVTMPPRHSKSMTTSEFFPAWYLGRNPSRYIICATYAADLAHDFGRKVRALVDQPLHRAAFPKFQLSADSRASDRFSTTLGGTYFALGVGGAATGRGAHLLLIDDPTKNRQEAESEATRKFQKDWYRSVARTRLMPGGAVVLVLTRWHEDDLAGWQLKEFASEGWEVVNFPAICEKDNDEIGRVKGQALWPDFFPIDVLEQTKEVLGSYEWSALYQQRPAPLGGGMIKLEWFETTRYLEAPPREKFIRVIHSWDTGQKDKEVNDPSVCTVWGETQTGYYLLDVFRKQMIYPELKKVAQSLADRDRPDAILIEDKSSGQSMIQEFKTSTALPIIAIEPDGDKVVRMLSTTPLMEAKKVWLPRHAPWLVDYEDELVAFPNATHDDQVDSTSQALKWLKYGARNMGLFEMMREEHEAMKRLQAAAGAR